MQILQQQQWAREKRLRLQVTLHHSANYSITQPSLTADITGASLTISGITADNKVYNGLTNATISGTPAYVGLQNGETFAVTGTPSAAFATASAANGKTVTVSGYTAPSPDYIVVQPSLTANITAALLTITGVSANNKVYNGLTNATLSGTAAYSGLQNGESFGVTGTPVANFDNANVGTGKAVTVSGYTAPNTDYTVAQPAGLTADITTGTVVITPSAGQHKTYGSTDPPLTYTANPAVTLTGNLERVAGENAGSYSFTLGTLNAGSNYTLTIDPTNTFEINTASLTVTANDVTKVAGTTLTGGSGSVAFTTAGLQNGETVGTVTITYGSAAASNAPAGIYPGQVVASAATGGTFDPINYTINYVAGTIDVTANNCPVSTSVSPATAQAVCAGTAANGLTASVTNGSGDGTPTLQYQWYYNTSNSNTVSGSTLIPGATSSSFTPATTSGETGDRYYFCVGYAVDNNCNQTNTTQGLASNAVKVTVNALPVVSFSGLAATYCSNASAVTLTGSPAGGTFSGSGISGASFDPAVAGAGSHVITYSYTNGNGCSNTATQSVMVNAVTSNSTTVAACDSYTWPVNNQTYTLSGTYTSVTGCHTEILDLTINHVTLTASATNVTCHGLADGTITANGSAGSTVTVNGSPLSNPYGPGDYTVVATIPNTGGTGNCTATVTVTITEPSAPSITATAGAGGSISPTGTVTLTCGGTQSYTITPAAGFQIASVAVDGFNNNAAVNSGTYTFNNVIGNHTISAIFTSQSLVDADPALIDVNITDAGNPVNANLIPYQSVYTVNVPILNLALTNAVPSGTVKVKIDLGDKLILNNPAALQTTLPSEFSWTVATVAGHQVITGDQVAPLAIDFDENASFEVKASVPGTSLINSDVLITNHNNPTAFLVDIDLTNNHSELQYTVLSNFTATLQSATNVSCFGGNNGSITVLATGGSTPYRYSIDGGTTWQASPIFSNLVAGSYTVTAEDFVGQSATVSYTVTQPAAIAVTNVAQTTILCHGGNATVTITATGGTAPLSYTFDGVTNSTGIFTHVAGVNLAYSVTDANSCTAATGTFTITEPAAIAVTGVTQSTILCHGGNATVTITATGGTAPLSYTFDGVTNSTGIFTHVAGVNLAYSVTDANSCTAATGTFTITEPAAIAVTGVTQSTILCHGGNATVTITATGGTSPLSYTFDGVTNSTGIFTHAAGVDLAYSVTDANSCTAATGTFTITEPEAIAVTSVTQSTILCHGGNATVTITATGGTAPLSYTFDGITNSTGIFTHVAGVNLAYSVTDANSCTAATGTFTITEPEAIAVTGVTQSTILCHGGNATVTITATGGTAPLSYTFDGVTNSTGIFTHAAGLNLAYSVTDANSCTAATGTFTITEPAAIAVTGVTQSTILCHGGNATVTITATGGTAPLSYTFDGVTNSTGIFTHAAGVNLAYSVTDANSCTAATGTFTITEPEAIAVTGVTQSTILCHGGNATVTITATGGTAPLSYTFDGITNSTGIFTHAAGVNLAYSVTDANSCTAATGTFTITEPAAIAVTSVTQSTILCHGGNATVTITATGGTAPLSYTFDGVTNSTGIFTHVAGVNLAYSVTDANSCTAATGTFTITEPEAISVTNVAQTTILCHGGNATVTITATGGTSPLSYTFDGVTNSTGIFTHAAGVNLAYSVTDANSCTAATGTFTITEPEAISVTNVAQTTILCHGGNATVTITATGGTAPLSYTFDGVTNSTGIFTHAAGVNLAYSVTDANSCTAATGTFTITEPAAITASESNTTITCYGDNATVTITATGGTSPLSYTFDSVTNSTGIFTHVAGANLTYSVTDANSCTAATGTVTITQPAIMTATVTSTNAACAGNYNSGTITISNPAGGSGSYEYSINGGSTWQSSGTYFVNAGIYNVQIRDANHTGCVRTLNASLIITEAANTDISIGSQTSDNLFLANGDEKTIMYNITELNGKAATPSVLRIFKPSGYQIVFNPAMSSWTDPNGFPTPVTYTLDNSKWVLTTSNSSYVEYSRTGPAGNNTVNCNEQIRIAFTLKRNTLNISKFNLNVQYRPATGEVRLNNNTNSIIFTGE